MAICDLCNNEMTTGASCSVVAISRDGIHHPLPAFSPASGWARPDGRCGDCGVVPGGQHHVGCDAQRCPRCRGQLISCECEWCDDDLEPQPRPAPPPRPPVGSLAGEARQRHGALLRELAAWSLSEGRPTDLDLASLFVDLLMAKHGPFPWHLDRPDAQDIAYSQRDGGILDQSVELPDGRLQITFDLVRFLAATGRVDLASVPLEVLLEPFRCAGSLDPSGEPMGPASLELELPCQCYVPHDPSLPTGTHQHFVGWGHEDRPLAARGVVLRSADDPPVSRLLPLYEFLRGLRRDESPWDLGAEDLRYIGEVFATKDSPALSAYRLEDDRHGRWPPLLLDRSGTPWAVRPHRGRKVGYRWEVVTPSPALWQTGIAQHLLQSSTRAGRRAG